VSNSGCYPTWLLFCYSHQHRAAKGAHDDDDVRNRPEVEGANNREDDDADDDESVRRARAWDDWKDGMSRGFIYTHYTPISE